MHIQWYDIRVLTSQKCKFCLPHLSLDIFTKIFDTRKLQSSLDHHIALLAYV